MLFCTDQEGREEVEKEREYGLERKERYKKKERGEKIERKGVECMKRWGET